MPKGRPKHQPQRTCVGCRESKLKRELVRVVLAPDGTIQVDKTGKVAGRGAYLCPRKACWETAIQRRQIGRALKRPLTSEELAGLQAFAEQLPDGSEE